MSNEDALKKIITQFQQDVMEDDTLAQLVLSALTTQNMPENLPDFLMEPWYPVDPQSELPKFGVRFTLSATTGRDGFTFTAATFQYLEVLVMTTEQGDRSWFANREQGVFFDASDAFAALEAPDDLKRAAAKRFSNLWQEFYEAACTLGAELDPLTDTFTTEQRSYCME